MARGLEGRKTFLPSRTTMLLTGLTIGILFAPRTGRGTRALIVQKYRHWINQISRGLDTIAKKVRYESNRIQGVAHEMKETLLQKEDEGKDEALPQRVKSELGRFFNVSDLDITNREGVITLRGGVPNEQERQNMIDMAKKIKGVREVVNMLY